MSVSYFSKSYSKERKERIVFSARSLGSYLMLLIEVGISKTLYKASRDPQVFN
jgi:hypothetical protein